jgi:hypothetical protein
LDHKRHKSGIDFDLMRESCHGGHQFVDRSRLFAAGSGGGAHPKARRAERDIAVEIAATHRRVPRCGADGKLRPQSHEDALRASSAGATVWLVWRRIRRLSPSPIAAGSRSRGAAGTDRAVPERLEGRVGGPRLRDRGRGCQTAEGQLSPARTDQEDRRPSRSSSRARLAHDDIQMADTMIPRNSACLIAVVDVLSLGEFGVTSSWANSTFCRNP